MTSLTSCILSGVVMSAAEKSWALQDAKARFSNVVKKAENEGPQFISVRGKPSVVVISQGDYFALIATHETLVDFFRRSPLVGVRFSVKSNRSLPRDIEL